jgi:hypothetical protein
LKGGEIFLTKLEIALWFSFIISGLFSILALIIGYWYINYKY